MNLNKLPDGTDSPKYKCVAVGEDGTEKSVILTEWWCDGKLSETIEKSAENYFYEESGFDKKPFKILSIEKLLRGDL